MPPPRPLPVALTGLIALAIAMGIGRFAFTPILPIMLEEGVLDLSTASWLASANYIGYLLGAVICTCQPWIAARLGRTEPLSSPILVRGGLVATALLTAAMGFDIPSAWAELRFAAGVAGAVTFVHTSGWCLAQLARMNVPAMGALIYIGPGAGIALGGFAAAPMVAARWTAAEAWLAFGALAAVLATSIWSLLSDGQKRGTAAAAMQAHKPTSEATTHGAAEVALITCTYGLSGFGVIITATFLPVIARQALPASPLLDLFWPIFGISVVVGAFAASRMRLTWDLRLVLVACCVVQVVGVAASLASSTLAGFAIGSILLGLPFTATTFYAMQEMRRIKPANTASSVGIATVMYGLGQIVGPLVAAALVARSPSAAAGFNLSLLVAAAALSLSAGLFLLVAKVFPASKATLR